MGNKLKENIFNHCALFFSAVKHCIINLEELILFLQAHYPWFLFSFYGINAIAIKTMETKNSWQLILGLVGLNVSWAAQRELVKEFTCCNCNKGNLKTTICFKSKMNNWILSSNIFFLSSWHAYVL